MRKIYIVCISFGVQKSLINWLTESPWLLLTALLVLLYASFKSVLHRGHRFRSLHFAYIFSHLRLVRLFVSYLDVCWRESRLFINKLRVELSSFQINLLLAQVYVLIKPRPNLGEGKELAGIIENSLFLRVRVFCLCKFS